MNLEFRQEYKLRNTNALQFEITEPYLEGIQHSHWLVCRFCFRHTFQCCSLDTCQYLEWYKTCYFLLKVQLSSVYETCKLLQICHYCFIENTTTCTRRMSSFFLNMSAKYRVLKLYNQTVGIKQFSKVEINQKTLLPFISWITRWGRILIRYLINR